MKGLIGRDLKAAGIPVVDPDGQILDFHSLRHTYCTLLARSGVTPKELQELARHHTAAFTLDRYAHATLYDLANAADMLRLPVPTDESDQSQALRATGTDGVRLVGQLVGDIDFSGQTGSIADKVMSPIGAVGGMTQPQEMSGTYNCWQGLSLTDVKAEVLGFEPRLADPESAVLPLHHTSMELQES